MEDCSNEGKKKQGRRQEEKGGGGGGQLETVTMREERGHRMEGREGGIKGFHGLTCLRGKHNP